MKQEWKIMKITLLTGKIFDIQKELDMDIKIIQSRSLNKLTLHIDNKERLPVLSLPKFCTRKKAIKFVNENMDWIIENLKKLPEIKYFSDGLKIMIFGENLQISHQPQARCGVRKDNKTLIVSGGEEFIHRRVKDYIKKRAESEFYLLSSQMAKKIGYKLNSICIKDTKSRWGSCSSLNNINYSWRIALAPKFVINYLMAHEVAHLKHQNHSPEFWNCVEYLYPQWKKGHNWLKENGKSLYSYK